MRYTIIYIPVFGPSFLTVSKMPGSPQSHTGGLLQGWTRGRHEGRGKEGIIAMSLYYTPTYSGVGCDDVKVLGALDPGTSHNYVPRHVMAVRFEVFCK